MLKRFALSLIISLVLTLALVPVVMAASEQDATLTGDPLGDPTNLAATTISDTQINLTWVKGDGADKTMIRRKVGSYPTSYTDGVQAYFDTGTSHPDTGLSPGTPYYYRAWAYNGGNYSNGYTEDNATTRGPPSVTTSATTNIEETTATLSGSITSLNGYSSADQRGFDWDIDSGAPYAHQWTETGSYSTGDFSHGITSLTKGELYYFRAKAHNDAGWGYGSELTFLTKPDPPYSFSATATASGTISLTWSKGAGAQKTYIRGKAGSYPADRADGYLVYNDTGTTTDDTGLTGGQTYYYRAWSYAAEGGEEQYSDAYAQDYAMAIASPSVTTNDAEDVKKAEATLKANITDTGGQACNYRGFVWDTTTHGNPGNTAPADSAYTYYNTEGGSFGTGIFTHQATELDQDQTYYVRGCAHNAIAGWSYGTEKSFTTPKEVLWFQPNAIVSGTTLPDRAGNNDATITWGTNPTGVLVTMGSLEPGTESQLTNWTTETPGQIITEVPDMQPEMFTEMDTNHLPGAELVNSLLDAGGIPKSLFWFPLVFGLAIAAAFGTYYFTHSLLALSVAAVFVLAFHSVTGVIPFWIVIIVCVLLAGVNVSKKVLSW